MPKIKATIPRLQDRLPLFRFFCAQLGAETGFEPLREILKNALQGHADDGHSHFFHALASQSGVKVADKLSDYDFRIKQYVARLNQGRTPPVRLLYFQWLAVLFNEMFLDRLFGDSLALGTQVDAWATTTLPAQETSFPKEGITKVAFWMATGSGKTLIMHLNLWQAQYYAQRAGRTFDNVLLVTPNEGLSGQHLHELAKSGIAARHYKDAGRSLFASVDLPVTVIEITKLTESKRGGGLSVDVEAFGPNNLLFVDEGHRGASGEVWRSLRERVAERGFTFEYSATFGQIVNGAGPDEKRRALLREYSQAILVDYSYPHFYDDGYGKGYWVVNVKEKADTFSEGIMLANLLSFFEQVLVFDENADAFRAYAIERPLWVFVGHSVTGGKTKDDQLSLTDVERIVSFFDKFLKQPAEWTARIKNVLCGKSGLESQGSDVFHDRFTYLKEKAWGASQIFAEIVKRVFDAVPGETLRATRLKVAGSEIGLRVGEERPYFGVINVGDVPGLASLLEETGIACDDDAVHTSSLFDEINETDSPVNVLIGARKFMEGWDSFRVSSMGLMNIGRGEGSQIIQLFGRGVRLHGKGSSLKRSTFEGGTTPKYLHLLETLNVFGVRANYMQGFREELQREGIETDFEILDVPIQIEKTFLDRGLQMLRLPEGTDFASTQAVITKLEPAISVVLDVRPKLELADSTQQISAMPHGDEVDRSVGLRKLAPLLNWQRIYFELLDYKGVAELGNLSFTMDFLRKILHDGNYTLYCSENQLAVSRFADLRYIEDIASGVLRKYLARLYDHSRRSWEQENLQLRDLEVEDPSLTFKQYEVTTKRDLAEMIRKLVKEADGLYKKDLVQFPTVHFGRHLYQPLLAFDQQDRYRSTPPLLNAGETRLVRDLRNFFQNNMGKLSGKEVFLLRNLSRGHGIGFFTPKDSEAFYPDFILWVIGDGQQSIAFIDPHGLGRARGLNDPKIQLYRELSILQPNLQMGCKKWVVHLTSFIVSPTPYEDVRKGSWVYSEGRDKLESEHVLFQEAGASYANAIWTGISWP